jgi:hypothetical protein
MKVTASPPCADFPPAPPLDDLQALRAKMRELIWRMDQVAEQLRSPLRAMDDQTLSQVLDTDDAKTLLTGGVDDFR